MSYFIEYRSRSNSAYQTQIYISKKDGKFIVTISPELDESKSFGPYRSKARAERVFVKLIRKHLAKKKRGLTHVGFL